MVQLLKNTLHFVRNAFFPSADNNYAPTFLGSRVLVYITIVLLVAKIIAAGFLMPFPKNFFFADVTKIDLVNLLNQNRTELGLNALQESEKLNLAAEMKARDMVANGYFSHNSPKGVTPWAWFKQVDYKYKYAGENLAVGFVDSKNAYDAWYNSPSHKANLLNKNYREVGTAVVQGFGENKAILIVQMFGNPVLASPAKPAAPVVVAPVVVPNNPKPVETVKPVIEVVKPVQDAAKPLVQNEADEQQKVLASTDQYSKANGGKDNFYYRFLNFMIYDSDNALAYLSYAILLLTGACLLISLMIEFQGARRQLGVRTLVMIGVLYASTFITQELMYQFMPYQVII
ncbi:MAG: CAP domain-containing protein [bacterium]|nr:CAP domain-containing protein [bacterium]